MLEMFTTALDVFDELNSVDPATLMLLTVGLALTLALLIAVIVWPLDRAPRLSRTDHDLIRRWGSLR